jgi:DNA replication and repair protein RecF
MILASIKLSNFRIHDDVDIEFSENLNYIVGGNGQGKTSILESIYYLCTTKSFIAKADTEVIKFEKDGFNLQGKFVDKTENNVLINFINGSGKDYYLNQKLVNRSSEIIGKFPVVLLTPEDHSITQGVPGQRRKFIDSVISQASSTYLKNLLDYNRTLKQRSSLLNKINDYRSEDIMIEFDAWTEKLIDTGTELIKGRINFIRHFKNYVKESYYRIMSEEEIPFIDYKYLNNCEENDVRDCFKKLLFEVKQNEIRRASNLVGPHKDDFIFSVNGVNLKTYGSQGQHKTFQAVLRFAEFFYLKDITSKTPLFLLDDVFGELDGSRAHKISDYLKEVGQAFITLTDFGNFNFLTKDEKDKILKLSDRKISYA